MNTKFDEPTVDLARSVTWRAVQKKLGVALAGMALACVGLANTVEAQTSIVCDPAGDVTYSSGKGGPQIPDWLDLVQTTITDAGDSILFTLKVKAPIPWRPAWKNADEGGQFWWSWRLVGDLAQLSFVSNGCLQAKGKSVPACYCLDLIWNVQTASFRSRLLDDTSCTEIAVPLVFSPDRREACMLVSKVSLSNPTLISDPNSFQYLAETIVWKASSNGNTSLHILDDSPSQTEAVFLLGTWSSSTNTDYGCP